MSWRDAVGILKDVLPQDMKSEEIIWCHRNEWSYDDYRALKRVGVDPRDHESPLAAFAEALLQPEVVEAAARILYSHHPARIWHTPTESTALPWEETASEDRAGKRSLAKKQLTAALAALQHDDAPVE